MKTHHFSYIPAFFLFLFSAPSFAAVEEISTLSSLPDFTRHWAGYAALMLFIVAYLFVIIEEKIHLRKSKPLMVAAGLIWVLATLAYSLHGRAEDAVGMMRHNALEFAELFMFLLSAMTYINTMKERNVFEALRARLTSMRLSLKGAYWMTGLLAFFISPVADNLTTALVMGAVVTAINHENKAFVAASFVNIVVAANAGGAFSPFGDITTLMVWQKGLIGFWGFFALFVPALVSWLIPAVIMSFAVPSLSTKTVQEKAEVKDGGYAAAVLFLLTIAMTVVLQHALGIPPFLGMMTGLGFLKLHGFFLHRREKPFDIFNNMKSVEWDTLMFFYGVMMCVGGLGALGYLAVVSDFLYTGFGATAANISVGLLSSVIDNIPVMFAVLNMNLDMDASQWLLVTLTAGIGGSLLSIGSAAGVALMGQARGLYTFTSHLKWTWAIALGYAAGILVHYMMNMG